MVRMRTLTGVKMAVRLGKGIAAVSPAGATRMDVKAVESVRQTQNIGTHPDTCRCLGERYGSVDAPAMDFGCCLHDYLLHFLPFYASLHTVGAFA